jgi:Flp pilus assembly protein TadD
LLGDLAQAKVRIEDWEGARAAAKAAIGFGGDTPYILNLYSQILENRREFVAAEEMMRRAVLGDPTNPTYRHRLGRIAQQQGKKREARDQYRKSVELDPHYQESWLSFASISADLGEFDAAEDALAHAEKLPVRMAVVLNVKAKIALMRGELNAAQKYIDAALQQARDHQNLGLAVRILAKRAYVSDITRDRAKSEIALLGAELTDMGHPEYIDDVTASWPDYFDQK